MIDSKANAARALDDHARSINHLHEQLAATPGCDTERLQKAVDTYKTANQAFHDDALGCVG